MRVLWLVMLLAACTKAAPDADNDGFSDDDCDDADANVNPDAEEVCDNVDNNCDGAVDEAVSVPIYHDADGDAYGDDATVRDGCPGDGILRGGDCDDADDQINPEATEVCDEADNNCDGETDEGLTVTVYADPDDDGYGADDSGVLGCPDGQVTDGGDCDDGNRDIYPGAPEVCNGEDDDCDTLVDDDDDDLDVSTGMAFFADHDGDTWGTPDETTLACVAPDGFVEDGGDCDDLDIDVSPDGTEVCGDGVDQDCSGVADDTCVACADVNILEYADSFTTTPAETGAGLIGATVSLYNGDDTGFAAAYDAGTWDLVVVDVPGSSMPSAVSERVGTAISGGGKVVFSWWSLEYDPTLAATLGVTVSSSYSTPMGFGPSGVGSLWTYPTALPAAFASYSDDAGVNGQVLAATDAATSVTYATYTDSASDPAILSTHDGQVLVQSFLPWDWQSTDDDADGTSDMAALYANEIVMMTGCRP